MPKEYENGLSLGSWLRRRRKTLDLTQAALAQRVGCAEVTIRKLEANAVRPSPTIAKRLAGCLELNPDERAVFLRVAHKELPIERLGAAASPGALCLPATEGSVEALPLDYIPHPAPLAPGSRMPLSRNPLFVGREADLRQLAATLHQSGTAPGQAEIAAITGLGGIGKTQLVCEFVHRYGQFFPGGVFWLSFADAAAVPAELAGCGGGAGMDLSPEFGSLPLDEQVQRVISAWERPIARLLIFDNCEDEALLQQWRPMHGGCRVLLTSRRHHWNPALGVQAVPLNVLSRTDSLALLCALRPDLRFGDPDLHAIAETLGDLPLALHLAGSFLAHYRHALTPAQYRARLQTPSLLDDRSLREAGLSPTAHVQHVARTFEQSFGRLDPVDPVDALARTLLAHAACFAPGEPLPRWLLLDTLDLPDGDTEHSLVVEDALVRLIDLGLLETDVAGTLRLHRLLVAFVQTVLVTATLRADVEAVMLRVINGLNEQRNPRLVLTIQPHLRFLIEAAQHRADASAAGLCHALGYHLWQLGVYAQAQHYLQQALTIQQSVLGAEHADTARSLNNLGVTLWAQGQYAPAQRYLEQAVMIRQFVLGADHPDTARSLNNLGGVLQLQGRYAAAQGYYQQAVAICERVLGAEHPHTAMSLNNLGMVLYEQGQYAAAQQYLHQAVKICERVLGAEHPHTAMSLNNLGMAFAKQEHYATAQEYYAQALAIQQRVLGAEHPDTAASLDNLAMACAYQGHYVLAQSYLEQALAIQQRVLGAEHPLTATSLCHLGDVLRAAGQQRAAHTFYEQALAIQQRVLSADHPDTARSLKSLGELLIASGDMAQAWRYLDRALSIFQQQLGSQHPDTIATRRTLGTLQGAPVPAGG